MSKSDHALLHAQDKDPEYCKVCNKVSKTKYKVYCSRKCMNIDRETFIKSNGICKPKKEALVEDINNLSWCAIGRKYGVSDNAVRKWARKYKII
jgi:endogenous inhibitor of DNA gyrase (YacG/DUF329 family)